jgi:hypothetical protein
MSRHHASLEDVDLLTEVESVTNVSTSYAPTPINFTIDAANPVTGEPLTAFSPPLTLE